MTSAAHFLVALVNLSLRFQKDKYIFITKNEQLSFGLSYVLFKRFLLKSDEIFGKIDHEVEKLAPTEVRFRNVVAPNVPQLEKDIGRLYLCGGFTSPTFTLDMIQRR